MKLFQAGVALSTINEYFENEKIDFVTACRLCDLISFLEKQDTKYKRLMQKFLKENYDLIDDNEDGGMWKLKCDSEEFIHSVSKEKNEIESIELDFEKLKINKIEKITPKVLKLLLEFFEFIDE